MKGLLHEANRLLRGAFLAQPGGWSRSGCESRGARHKKKSKDHIYLAKGAQSAPNLGRKKGGEGERRGIAESRGRGKTGEEQHQTDACLESKGPGGEGAQPHGDAPRGWQHRRPSQFWAQGRASSVPRGQGSAPATRELGGCPHHTEEAGSQEQGQQRGHRANKRLPGYPHRSWGVRQDGGSSSAPRRLRQQNQPCLSMGKGPSRLLASASC